MIVKYIPKNTTFKHKEMTFVTCLKSVRLRLLLNNYI